MKTAKRVLSIALVVVLLFSIVSVSASAASSKLGYMVPTNNKFTKVVSTVNLYGDYDYVNFKLNYKGGLTVFAFMVFSDAKMENLVAYDTVMMSEDGVYEYSVLFDLRSFKSGTYYCATVGCEDWGDEVIPDESSMKTFKMKVNRKVTFDKQVVVLRSSTQSVNGPVIKWNKLKGATKYIIYRRPVTGTKWTRLATTMSTSYTDKSLVTKSGSYIYTVKAVNKNNTASRYHYGGSKIDFVGAPKISSIKVSGNDYTVRWNKISGVETYYVYRKVEGYGWSKLGTVTDGSTSFVDKRAKSSGTKYIYTVKAVRSFNDGKVEGKCHSGKSVVYVAAPKVRSIATTSDNATIIKWYAVNNSTYTVYRKVEGSGWTILAKEYKGTTFTDRTAKKDGTNYIYTVRATQNTSYGTLQGHYVVSNAFGFTTMPENIVATSNEAGVKLTWDTVASAKRYTVYSKNVDGTGSWVKLGTTDTNEFVDTVSGVEGARIYTVRSEGNNVRGSYSSKGIVYFNAAAPVLTIEGDNGNYTISWEAVAGAEAYAVYKKVEGGDWTLVGTTTELNFADILTEEGVYSYSVTALRGEANGVFNDTGYIVNYSIAAIE